MAQKKSSWLRNNGLSLVMLAAMLLSLVGQIFTGWHHHNEELAEDGAAALTLASYLTSGHFLQATFENWESEFLQMGFYVVLTAFLYQKGSAESKDPEKAGEEEVDREPQPGPDAPWPVQRGGAWLALYKNSLSLVLVVLFLLSFFLHFVGSYQDNKGEQLRKGETPDQWTEYIAASRFWFESFQNWQSEFLSVLTIVLLTIWFRQKGSSESKPVDAPDDETGS
jgi:hypothetical protein